MRTAKIKIWMQFLTTIAIALVVVWTGVIIWQGYVARQSALEQAKEFSLSMHDATMAGLTGMMVTGTVSERHVFLDQIQQLGSIREVKVIRGKAVSDTFGPGTAKDDTTGDATEQQVMQTGKDVFYVESDAKG